LEVFSLDFTVIVRVGTVFAFLIRGGAVFVVFADKFFVALDGSALEWDSCFEQAIDLPDVFLVDH